MNKIKIAALCVCLAAVLFALASCGVLSSSAEERETVLTVGEFEVPYEQYYYISQMLKQEMPSASEEEIEEETFSMLKEIYAVFSLAEDYGIASDDKYIASIADDAAKLAIEECGGKSEYKKALAKSYMNDSVFKFLKRHSQTADELLSALSSCGKYPSDDASIKRLVLGDGFVCVKQILVVGENSVSIDDTYFNAGEKHTDEEALAIAEKARDRALAGEDFDSLVNEYGESLYMFNNTDGYYVCRGMWDEPNENAVFDLEVGEISTVIKSDVGYSVFLCCEKSEAYVDANVDKLAESYYLGLYNQLLNERIAELEIKTNEAYDSHVGGEAE